MQLDGRTALITGAGSGIGRALAIEAARRGMVLALAGRRAAALEETRALLAQPAPCLVLPGDVTRPEAREAIRGQLGLAWGRLDVLVNNAGLVEAGPLAATGDGALERLLATNLLAPMALTRELLPLLGSAAPARVVNLGSMVGDIALPLFAAYSASKFGLRGLSNALRRELAGAGIGVTYAAPRGAATDASRAVAAFTKPFAMKLDGADAIARRLWDAVARERDAVYPRGPERLFVLVERLFPRLVSRSLAARLAAGGGQRLIDGAGALEQA